MAKFQKKLLTHFVTSCRELLSLRQILNHPPLILPVFSVTRARAAPVPRRVTRWLDGRWVPDGVMGGIFRWGRRASDDGALLNCIK